MQLIMLLVIIAACTFCQISVHIYECTPVSKKSINLPCRISRVISARNVHRSRRQPRIGQIEVILLTAREDGIVRKCKPTDRPTDRRDGLAQPVCAETNFELR
jgi:hypothetical protein